MKIHKKMINCKYILICENVIVDSASKAVSLINIINGIKVSKVPASIPLKFVIHTAWEKSEKKEIDDIIQLAIKHPDGGKEELLAESKIPGSSLNHNYNLNILGLNIDNFGDLYFIAKIKEGENFREIRRCEFKIGKSA